MFSNGIIKVTAVVIVAVVIILFLSVATKPVEITKAIQTEIPFISEDETIVKTADGRNVGHVKKPDVVKALYMTSWVAGSPSIRPHVVELIDTTEANAIVLDIKDDTGMISYVPSDPSLLEVGNYENRISDIREFIQMLHDKNIYVIGRVAVFQDPALTKDWPDQAVQNASTGAVWADRKGISWMDAGSKKVWDYAIAIARDSYAQGFDEINFDYVRFPTDGNLKTMHFPLTGEGNKSDMIEKFFTYLGEKLKIDSKNRMVISADLFGMVTTAQDDLGIGQVLEKVVPHVDYVGPMVYPSHYPNGFHNLGNPNENVYEVIYAAMMGAKNKLEAKQTAEIKKITARTNKDTGEVYYLPEDDKEVRDQVAKIRNNFAFSKIRPWLQDFDYGGEYGVAEVRAQMQAAYDTGLTSWMMWDPSNKYTAGAYKTE